MTSTVEERALFASELRRLVDRLPAGSDAEARAARQVDVRAMGLIGLTVPVADGGQGAGLVELGAVGEAFGRSLVDVPYLGTSVLAGETLWRCSATISGLLDGSARPGVALDLRDGARIGTVRLDPGREVRVTGDGLLVLDAAAVDRVLVLTDGAVLRLAEVPADADGATLVPIDAVDASRSLARFAVAHAAATIVAEGPWVEVAARRAVQTGWLYLAAESLGAAAGCLDQMVGFAQVRTTFNRPIGSYQAIKHRCVDRWIDVERARALLDAVLTGSPDIDPDHLGVLHLAVATSLDALHAAARDNVLVHGAIGFTAEHRAHRYVRRARAAQALLGSPHWHRMQAIRFLRDRTTASR